MALGGNLLCLQIFRFIKTDTGIQTEEEEDRFHGKTGEVKCVKPWPFRASVSFPVQLEDLSLTPESRAASRLNCF